MSNNDPFVVTNATPQQVGILQSLCLDDGGTFETFPEPGGNVTTMCTLPAAGGATPAVVSAAAGPLSVAPSSATAASFASISPNAKDRDLAHLHPLVRKKVKALEKKLKDANIPMKVFEGFRTPQRQAYLYAKGRTTPGSIVTNAEPWESYHQYGVAADFVRFENGGWNWNTGTSQQRKDWDDYHDLARSVGLEPLSWEKPHVQLIGTTLSQLMNGDYPEDGDESWANNLSQSISTWPGGGTPPLPEEAERPPFEGDEPSGATPATGGVNWYSKFGGDAWAYDKRGFYTRNHLGQIKKWRTAGAPITVSEVIAVHGADINAASAKYGVPKALIVMTIATEAGAYRLEGFTGPKTFRWEQGYTVGATGDPALDGKEKGDYSAGPMQVLSDTARWMNNVYDLGYNNKTDFKFYKNKPNPNPTTSKLYLSDIAVDVGTAYIKHNMAKTGDDPLLVSAAYNAGGLYPFTGNHWRIKSHGNHLDRAAEWYGDATYVLNA